MEPQQRLHIIAAYWGPRSGAKFPVTVHLRQNLSDRGLGAFLWLPTLQSKKELLGDIGGSKLDLVIRYQLDDGPETEEIFGESREVFLGDASLYYHSISRQHVGVTADEADCLLYRFRPVLHLHPDEQSHPCSVEWYLPKTALFGLYQDAQVKLIDKVTDPAKHLNSYYTYAGQRFHTRESRRFFLKHNVEQPETRFGEKNNLDQVPFYGSCFVTPSGVICLSYFFFYAYNGSIVQGPMLPNWITKLAGVHEGDWEYLCILLSPRTHKIGAVFMSRHGKESHWYLRPSSSELSNDSGWHVDPKSGRVQVYCGKESHANYNTAGIQGRGYWGYIDDRCAKGPEWSPNVVVNLGTPANPRVPWLHYGGMWGKLKDAYVDHAGPTGPYMKSAFATAPPMHEKNTTPVLGAWWKPMSDD